MEFYNILLVTEGDEEYCFFKTIAEMPNVISDSFKVEVCDAGGFGGVGPLFQDQFGADLYDCVLCVYDVDFKADDAASPFGVIQNDLLEVLGSQEAVDAVSFCTNPNFLQIYLLGMDVADNVALHSTSKVDNTGLVHKYWPSIAKPKKDLHGHDATKNYDAKKWQLEIINESFCKNPDQYKAIIRNAVALGNEYRDGGNPGSNVPLLLSALINGDVAFFENIRKVVYKEETLC